MSFWYFDLPNYVLAALMYTVMARLVLTPFFGPDSRNYIWRGFVRVSEPVVAAVRLVTPGVAPHALVLVFATLWLFLARVAFLVAMLQLGALPLASGGGQ